MKRFYNYETIFKGTRDALRQYLKDNGIYYELSAGSGFYHFEIKADAETAENINRFLDSLLDNRFTEKREA